MQTNDKINGLTWEDFINCPINFALQKIGGKWKPVILHRLQIGINRFSLLQKSIPVISKQMLINQLRELEKDGYIKREVFPEVPPHVEYYITEKGKTIFPILDILAKWGKEQMIDK